MSEDTKNPLPWNPIPSSLDEHLAKAKRVLEANGFLVVRREDAWRFDVIQDFTGEARLDPSIMNLKLGPHYVIPVEEEK